MHKVKCLQPRFLATVLKDDNERCLGATKHHSGSCENHRRHRDVVKLKRHIPDSEWPQYADWFDILGD